MHKLEVTARSYAFGVTVDEFLGVEAAEDGPARNDRLDDKLIALGCEKVEYNGHFGPYFYYSIGVEADTPAFRRNVSKTILDHVNKWKDYDVQE